jgi:hypothetical protein
VPPVRAAAREAQVKWNLPPGQCSLKAALAKPSTAPTAAGRASTGKGTVLQQEQQQQQHGKGRPMGPGATQEQLASSAHGTGEMLHNWCDATTPDP